MKPLSTAVNAPAASTAGTAAPATGAAAQAGGEAGAFALLLGCFTTAPALPPAAEAASVAADAIAMPDLTATAPALPAILSEDESGGTRTEDSTAALLPDAALVASLLGQLQAPYAMVTTALPADPPAAQPLTGGVSGTTQPLPAADLSDAPELAQAAAAEDALHADATQPADTAPDSAAAAANSATPMSALPVSAAHPDTATHADHRDAARGAAPSALAPQGASAEAIAAREAAAAAARPAAAAQPAASVQGDAARRADGAPAAERNGNAPAARAQTAADFRRALESQLADNADVGGEGTVQVVTAPAAIAAAAAPARTTAHHDARDHNGDLSGIGAAMHQPLAHRGDRVPPGLTIAPPLQSPEWQPAFANSVRLLVNEGSSAASLQLNPAEFGPIDVRIVMSEQRADISFVAAHPDANTAIQNALSELREQLARSGIQLGQTSVGAHPQQPRQFANTPQRAAAPRAASGPAPVSVSPLRPRASGNIDIYA